MNNQCCKCSPLVIFLWSKPLKFPIYFWFRHLNFFSFLYLLLRVYSSDHWKLIISTYTFLSLCLLLRPPNSGEQNKPCQTCMVRTLNFRLLEHLLLHMLGSILILEGILVLYFFRIKETELYIFSFWYQLQSSDYCYLL